MSKHKADSLHAEKPLQARRRFGQNFLHDAQVIARIIAAIDPNANDCMLEIGPGRGAITVALLRQLRHLHVVEIDRDLAARLRADHPRDRLSVYVTDALTLDLGPLLGASECIRVVGNLPYNISSPLIFHFIAQAERVRDMHFMLQKEVVERMAAMPGSKTYGRLSVMVQLSCQVEALFRVGPGAFNPPPKVDSSFVRLTPHATLPSATIRARVSAITAQAFARRRKTLRNALRGIVDAAQLEALGLDPATRPERLEVKDFIALADYAPDVAFKAVDNSV